jgi:prepilin-type processing-associated H-X9-DG protein
MDDPKPSPTRDDRVLQYTSERAPRSWPVDTVVCLALLTIAMAAVTYRLLDRPDRVLCSPRGACQSQIRTIAQALFIYANDNGRFPADFGELYVDLAGDVGADAFVCPTSTQTRAVGPTTRAVGAALSNPAHASYIYAAAGLNVNAVAPDVILVLEKCNNHGGGLNAVFGDGHAEFLPASNAKEQAALDGLLGQAAQGIRPLKFTPP